MPQQAQASPTIGPRDIDLNIDSFVRYLPENLSPSTIAPTRTRPGSLACPAKSPRCAAEHVEAFITLGALEALHREQRFRGRQQFFKCLEEEGEVSANPMARMRAAARARGTTAARTSTAEPRWPARSDQRTELEPLVLLRPA